MIYEYALDPSLVARWAIEGAGLKVRQFGMDQRRLVSDFPKNWKGRVYGEFYKQFGYDDSSLEFQHAQPSLDAYLQILGEDMVPRAREISVDADWLSEAILEHRQRRFHAILASIDSEDAPEALITEVAMNEVGDRRWQLPTINRTPKSALDIAEALGPILRIASRIFLIDPNFSAAKDRFLDTFVAILQRALGSDRALCVFPVITVITGVEQAHKMKEGEFTPEQMSRVASDICGNAQRDLPRHIPSGMAVHLIVLKNPSYGDPLHNRFVLTDVGGVVVPYGLDEYTRDVRHAAMDDLLPLPKGMYEELWEQYAELKSAEIVRGPEAILGNRRTCV